MVKIFYLFVVFFFNSIYSQAQNESDVKKKLEELAFFAGTWKVHVEFRLSSKGPWDTSEAKSVIIKTMGSKLFEEDFTGTRQGRPYFTKTLWAVNNLTKKYQEIFADSEHGTLIDFEGEKKGNALVFDKNWTYPDKSTVRLRLVYSFISKDEFTVENMRMPQNTTKWDKVGRMKYTRVN